MSEDKVLEELEKAYKLFRQGKFKEAVQLYKELITNNPDLARSGININLAHSIILSTDWSDVSQNLPPGINYPESSGWINSLMTGLPINYDSKPIPWYTYPAIEFIENKIASDFQVFEYGSGQSTLWWAERTLKVISIESNRNWFSDLQEKIPNNVELSLSENEEEYAANINRYQNNYFDVIVIDGINRNRCVELSLSKLKETGFIIFDNTDDYQYDLGVRLLELKGYKRIDFYGMIPGYTYKNCTSVFFKDSKVLDRGGLPSEKESCLGLSCFQVTSPRSKNNCMLKESNIAECQAKFNLSYHVPFARICQDLVGFEGKDVLEVGGSLPPEFVFDYLHVKSWSAIETPDYEESLKEAGGLSHTGTIIPNIKDTSNLGFDNRKLEKYNFFLENIENLPEEYYGKYDLIFSIATFEHIHKLPAALDKMFLALKPGGKLFSMFSPIWSAYDGHHLPKITDQAGKVFNFGNSPIPPWGHLLMKPDELCHYLYQYTDQETAELMVDYVYNSPHINRYFTEDYLEIVKRSKFQSKQIELIFENPIDEKTQEKLEKLYPGRKQFRNNGLLVVLEKLTNKLGKQQIIDSKKNMTDSDKSVLERIIPPEIKNDEFSMAIEKITREEYIKTVLEIGSSSGEGSTAALVKGMSANPNNPTLFCIEVSQTRFKELEKRYEHQSFVKPYNVSSVNIKDILKEQEVINFYQNYQTGLNNYPLETILSWFSEGNKYLIKKGLTDNGIDKIKQENNVDIFDVVLIDGSQFTGSLEFNQIYGAKYIMLDDINTLKNYQNHRRLLADPNYDLVAKNLFLRHGYSIFKRNEQKIVSQNLDLPIHFFTIVLNGKPFIRYHIDLFKQIPFKWHWHIIEGVAELNHDTSWCLKLGGKITDEIHKQGRSKDGTSEYLDKLAAKYPENVTIYRKPEGEFWDGKREMVNAPLANIKEECLLWQVDVDEIWTLEQIFNTRKLFIKNPDKTAAFYWCWYFVGENLLITTRNCYAQNPRQEWLRTWRFKPGYTWASHSPPILVENLAEGKQKNIAAINPFMHAETEKEGLIFQHFAYVTPEQLSFKEQYYGYKNAVSQWQTLQSQTKFPVYLRDYFAWVGDNTIVDSTESLGIVPLVQKDVTGDNWKFLQPEYLQQPVKRERRSPTILIDGVFFQLYSTGIARVWRSVLAEWAKTEFANHIILLDRANTAKLPGIRYRALPAYSYNNTDADKQMLQQVCDEEGADLFISTYYTTPISTPSVFMAYDMIPEVLGANFNEPMWREKHHAIGHASSYISISESTARDLVKFFPDITPDEVTVAHCGVAPTFTPATTTEISAFKHKYGISKPYFLLVGAGSNYKNAILFFRAFAQLHSKQGFEIVCTGSGVTLANEYRQYASGSVVHSLILSDEELKVAYSGAIALVYPSLYEGFGMPVAEALACGCPVITCANASIPEVVGEAAIYVDANDVDGLTDALCEVQKPKVRNSLIAAGLEQAKKFSWGKMADIMSTALMKATLGRLNLRDINLIIFPDWTQPEETVGLELQKVMKNLVTHPDRAKMTLLIDNSNITAEDADLILSSVAMNLLMEEELEIDEGPEIVLVGELSQVQWSALIPQLQGRIKLEHENGEAIAQLKAENIPVIELNNLSEKNHSFQTKE